MMVMYWRKCFQNNMIKITIEVTGFYVDKPVIREYTFDEKEKIVDTRNKTEYLGDLDPEGIEKWFVENHLLGTTLQDRLISIHVKKFQ